MKHQTPAARWAAAVTAAFAMSQADAALAQQAAKGRESYPATSTPLARAIVPVALQGTSTTFPMTRRSMNARSTRGASANG